MDFSDSPLVYESLLQTAPSEEQRNKLERLISERVEKLKQVGLDRQPMEKVLAEHAFVLWNAEVFRERVEDLLSGVMDARQCLEDRERLHASLVEIERKVKFLLDFMHSRG